MRRGRRAERGEIRELQARQAAEAYVVAVIAGDDAAVDDAVDQANPALLMPSVVEIACRAVQALARERGQAVEEVMNSLATD